MKNVKACGKPNLIYLGRFILENENSDNSKTTNTAIQESKIIQINTCNNYNSEFEKNENQEIQNEQIKQQKNAISESEKNSIQDMEKVQGNNTEYNNTNYNNTEISQTVNELAEIKNRCELELLEEVDELGNIDTRKRQMVENAIEMMYYSSEIKVDNAIIPQELVRKKLKQLNGAKLCYALDKLNQNLINTLNVTSSTKYLISCIYNAITEYYSDAEIQYKIDCLS